MFDLFIQIRDGQPYQHPIFGDNLRDAFPDIDTNNLPDGFARFIRHSPDIEVGRYEVLVEEYVWNDGVVEDNWHTRPMTEEEAAATRTEAAQSIESDRSNLLVMARSELESSIEEEKLVWQKYVDALESFTYEDPFGVKFPSGPRRNEDGTLMTLDSPGTAPDVTE